MNDSQNKPKNEEENEAKYVKLKKCGECNCFAPIINNTDMNDIKIQCALCGNVEKAELMTKEEYFLRENLENIRKQLEALDNQLLEEIAMLRELRNKKNALEEDINRKIETKELLEKKLRNNKCVFIVESVEIS